MTVRNLQAVGDEAGVLQPPALALRFRSPLTVTPVPEETSPGMVGNGQSVRGYTEIGVDPSASVSSYIQPTGSGGSSGLSVGRFDINALNPYAPIPGTLAIGNDDGSSYSLLIDNGSSQIASNLDLLVNGRTTVTGPIAANGGISVTGSLTVGGSSVVTVARTISTTSPLGGGGALSSNLTLTLGTVGIGNGGLGFTTATQGDLFYASAANTPAKLAVGGANTVLVGGGTTPAYSATPTLSSLALSSALLTSSGGTGNASYAAGDMNYYASGTAFTKLAIGSANRVLTSSGSAPQWSNSLTGLSSVSATALTVNAIAVNGLTPYRMAKGTTDASGTQATNGSVGQGIYYSAQASIVEILLKNESVGITADASNFANINVLVLDTTGATVATITISTKPTGTGATGNIAANAVIKFSTISGISLPVSYASSNYTLSWSVTKAGVGVITGPFEIFAMSIA